VDYKILHIINSFEFGGAETMLRNLLLQGRGGGGGGGGGGRFRPVVVSLIDDMSLAGPIVEAEIPLHVLGMRPGVPDPRKLMLLARLLRRERPAVVQTWMDHSNLLGAMAVRLARVRAPLAWGVHHSRHIGGISKRSTLWTVAACARLSRLPAAIVCCSEASRTAYAARGFATGGMRVIPNGFDTARFRPDPDARDDLRRELGLAGDVALIGLAARYDPLKDHETFLRAAVLVAREAPEVRFVLCGAGVDAANRALVSAIASLGLEGRCHLLGPRRDIARILAGLDLLVSSSISEAFPLAVGEAMACGVPCVVTDVGDSAAIVGPTGWVVPPRDPRALAAACRAAFELSPRARGRRGQDARRRIREHFELAVIARRYEALYESLIGVEASDGERTPAATPLLVGKS
jgi:glycosyltransferase involved in cell wall biosynthesis